MDQSSRTGARVTRVLVRLSERTRRSLVALGALLVLAAGLAGLATALSTTTDPAGAVVITALAVAMLAIAALIVLPHPAARHALARPRGAIDASVRLDETDPDAPGHIRPRAPGHAAPTA